MDDELDTRFGDELSHAAFGRYEVYNRQDGEHGPYSPHDGQLGQDGASSETRQTFVPQGSQELLAVWMSHKLEEKKRHSKIWTVIVQNCYLRMLYYPGRNIIP